MSASLRISRKSGKTLLDVQAGSLGLDSQAAHNAFGELRLAMKPKPKRPSVKRREERKKEKLAKRSAVRAEVFRRAGNVCELCQSRVASDLHHALGRPREAVSTCLALCRHCHDAIELNYPDHATVLDAQAELFEEMGHSETAAELLKDSDYSTAKAELSARSELSGRGGA